MKLHQSELLILVVGVLAVIAGLVIVSSKLAMLVAILIAVAGLWKKEIGLLFLLILIPVRPFLITVNPGFKIIGDAIIFFLLLRTLFDYRKDLKKLFSFHPIEWALFAFAVIGVVSALITGVSLKAIVFQLRAYFLFYLVFYIVKRMDLSIPFIRKMSAVTFIMAVILSIQGIVEKISSKTLLMPQEWQQWVLSPTNRIRVYGLLKGPNELSLYLVIAFFATLYLLKFIHGKLRIAIYIGLSLMGTTILLTYSRGTLLTLIVFLVVYLVLYRKWKPLVPVVAILVVSVVLFEGINYAADQYAAHFLTVDGQTPAENGQGNGINRYSGAFSDVAIGESNAAGRIGYVKKAVEVFKDHPIIGTGYGTFGGAATITYSSPIYKHYHITRNFYSDNQYILILAETGILGVLSIVAAAFFIYREAWNRRKEFYGPLLVYFFVALIVGSGVYNILENDSFMLYFFLLMGFALKLKQNKYTE